MAASFLDLLRGNDHHVDRDRNAIEVRKELLGEATTIVDARLDHQEVEIAVPRQAAAYGGAKEDDLVRVRYIHNPPDNLAEHGPNLYDIPVKSPGTPDSSVRSNSPRLTHVTDAYQDPWGDGK